MIRTALEFIQDELNLYIKKKDPVNFETKDLSEYQMKYRGWVIVSFEDLMKLKDSFFFEKSPAL